MDQTRPPDYETNDIDVSAAIITATGMMPEIHQGPVLAAFGFPNTEQVRQVVLRYTAGDLLLPVNRFARNRAWLYRQMRKTITRGTISAAPEGRR